MVIILKLIIGTSIGVLLGTLFSLYQEATEKEVGYLYLARLRLMVVCCAAGILAAGLLYLL